MSLAQIQRDFVAHILGADSAAPAAVGPAGRRGLAVYAHAYRANLTACLKDTYEKTLAWLGDEAFERAAAAHIAAHPPRSWTLGDYGETFAETLAGRYLADPEVAELAWLDWTLRRAFDGPDAAAADRARFAEVDWEHAVLGLAPTLTIGTVTTNAAALWTAMAEGGSPPPAETLDTPAALAVWRRGFSPMFRTLAPREAEALALAREGAPFGVLCERLAADQPDEEAAAAEAGGLLARWLDDQIVIDVAP